MDNNYITLKQLKTFAEKIKNKLSFTKATASVDSNSGGTPSVAVTLSDQTIDFAFHNLKGEDGSKWYSGTALTSTSSSSDTSSSSLTGNYSIGDYYIHSSYGYIYRCITAGTGSAAKWRYQGSIRGATGSTGSSTKWYTGTALSGSGTVSGNSSVNNGSYCYTGDMYLNTSSYDVYRCTTAGSGTVSRWTYQCNIKGATGSDASLMAALNRSTGVNIANTSYGTYMARGIAAGTTDLTPGVSNLTSGCIYLVYE